MKRFIPVGLSAALVICAGTALAGEAEKVEVVGFVIDEEHRDVIAVRHFNIQNTRGGCAKEATPVRVSALGRLWYNEPQYRQRLGRMRSTMNPGR